MRMIELKTLPAKALDPNNLDLPLNLVKKSNTIKRSSPKPLKLADKIINQSYSQST